MVWLKMSRMIVTVRRVRGVVSPLAVPQLRTPEAATGTRATGALSVKDEQKRDTSWGRGVSLFTLRRNRAFVTE